MVENHLKRWIMGGRFYKEARLYEGETLERRREETPPVNIIQCQGEKELP